MVRNNFMMHLCTFATLCFFKITFPRNYYYCNQDDTIPWVCVLKYVSNSNCCHRHLVLYISDVKKFPYLPKIYISAISLKVVLSLKEIENRTFNFSGTSIKIENNHAVFLSAFSGCLLREA